jgi:hypothetical protein
MVFKLVNAAAKTWVPTVTSHAEKSAHITSAMRQYTTSMSSVGLLGLDHVDAHFSENRQDILDLLRIGFLRGQYGVDLIDGDVAALLGAVDQLLDRRVGKVEQRKGHIASLRRPAHVPFRGRLDIACHKSLPDRR